MSALIPVQVPPRNSAPPCIHVDLTFFSRHFPREFDTVSIKVCNGVVGLGAYTYTCIYTCTYTCIYTCIYTCTCIYTYTCIYTCTYTCIYTCIYTCTCTCHFYLVLGDKESSTYCLFTYCIHALVCLAIELIKRDVGKEQMLQGVVDRMHVVRASRTWPSSSPRTYTLLKKTKPATMIV